MKYPVRRSHHLKKSWGQHLLVDQRILSQIASEVKRAAGNDPIIEFAAGTGNLTEYLTNLCKYVIAVEMERDVISELKKRFEGKKGIEIIEMNMMNFDFKKYYEKYGRLIIVGNLPYNLSKLFLFRIFENACYVKDAFLMFQYEVARRITAEVGEKEWSVMSVFARTLSLPEIIITAGKSSFNPPPKVDSSVVHLGFYDSMDRYMLYKGFNRIVQEIFNYPRKSLRNIIKSKFSEKFLPLIQERVDLNKRVQNLSLDEIKFIYEIIKDDSNE